MCNMTYHVITDCFKLAKLGRGDQVAFMNAKSLIVLYVSKAES